MKLIVQRCQSPSRDLAQPTSQIRGPKTQWSADQQSENIEHANEQLQNEQQK